MVLGLIGSVHTWIFNAGHQIGPEPSHIELDLTENTAKWVSLLGTEDVRPLAGGGPGEDCVLAGRDGSPLGAKTDEKSSLQVADQDSAHSGKNDADKSYPCGARTR